MGFEEVFVFALVGCIAIYRQRSRLVSRNLVRDWTQIIFLWMFGVACPSLAITWIILDQTSLPLIFVMTGFLLCVWISHNWQSLANSTTISNLNLTLSEEKQLRDCFPPAIYQLKDLEYRPQEIYCRGNLRSRNLKNTYDTINQNVQKIFGDRFVCYLQESPLEIHSKNFEGQQNEQQNTTKYSFYLIPSSDRSKCSSLASVHLVWIISILSVISTAFTVLLLGANIHRLQDINLLNLQSGTPYLLGITSIFIARVITKHYIAKRNKLRLDPPLLLPCIGGFGLLGSLSTNFTPSSLANFTSAQNHPNQRRVLFDLAVIPTIVGLVISLILLILGNWILIPTTPAIANPTVSLLPNLVAFDFKNSIFTTLLQNIFQTFFSIGKSSPTLVNDSDTILVLSPLTLAGWSGLALSALQLLPFDLLDGGNLAIAMFGHRQAVQIARIARLVLLAIALLVQPWLRIYSLLLFLLPTPRPLILNESIEIGRTRDLVGMILIAIALLIILPVPKSLI